MSDEVLDNVCCDLVGEPRAGTYGKYDGASEAVGASFGAVSRMEGDCGLEAMLDTEEAGWYDRRGEVGL